MTALLEAILSVPALLILATTLSYALEVLGALLPPRSAPEGVPGSLAVIVPAHNEGAAMEATLQDIKRELRAQDRLLVVADNCSDDTAEIAMKAGASVLIRDDPELCGKGYALQFALDSLNRTPPSIVIFIDADCRLASGSLLRLAGAAATSDRPVQALYLMRASVGAPAARKAAEFAWLLMNRVRMTGLFTLFDVCRLTGSGMALPWEIAGKLDLASDEIVEDLALGLHLVDIGASPIFCADAQVGSEFPDSEEAAVRQRARWELGTMRLAARRTPGLLWRAIGRRDIRLAAAALDAAIPPLSMLAASIIIMIVVSLIAAVGGAETPLEISLWAAIAMVGATALAWMRFGRDVLPPSAFGSLVDYLAQKTRVYGERARASTRRWTKTDRNGESDTP